MTERRKDEKEQGDKEEPVGLLANGLSLYPPVYLPDCDILADEESDQTYGFISKQQLDQTQPVQVLHRSDGCADWFSCSNREAVFTFSFPETQHII